MDLVRVKQAEAGEAISLALVHRKHWVAVMTVTLYQNLENRERTETKVQMLWSWVPRVQMSDKLSES